MNTLIVLAILSGRRLVFRCAVLAPAIPKLPPKAVRAAPNPAKVQFKRRQQHMGRR